MNRRDDAIVTKLANGNIIDTEKGTVTDGLRDIYLKGGYISAIRIAGEEGPEAGKTFDVNGRFVIPGMINTHCHNTYITPAILSDARSVVLTKKFKDLQIKSAMKNCIMYGVTSLRDALSDNLVAIDSLRSAIRNGEMPGPRIFTSVLIAHKKGACIQPSSFIAKMFMRLLGVPILDYDDCTTGVVVLPEQPDSSDLLRAVDEALKRGADFIKIYDQREKMLTYKPGADVLTDTEIRIITKYCTEQKVRTLMHQLRADSFTMGNKAGISSLAHLPIDRTLSEKELVALAETDVMIEPTLSLAYYYCWERNNKQVIHPRQTIVSEYRRSTIRELINNDWIPELRQTVAKHFDRAERKRFTMFGGMNMSSFFRYMDFYVSNGFDTMVHLLSRGYHDKISFGNDAGATQCSPASKDAEMDLLKICCKESGMRTEAVNAFILRVFTRNGAVALGRERELGSVKEGYRADLAVYNENPLIDIDIIKKKTFLTVADGRMYEHE